MAEASVVAACQRTLTRRRAWWLNVHGAGIGRNGIADILACYQGWFLAIECKAPRGGSLTKLQRYELDRVKLAGGVALVVRDVAHLDAVLDAIDAAMASRSAIAHEISVELPPGATA